MSAMTNAPTPGEAGIADIAAAAPSWRDFWRRFRRNRLAVVGLVILVFLLFVAVFADLLAPYHFTERPRSATSPPSWDHPFGTDLIGRDIMSRVIYGARISLRIGIIATLISMVIGVTLGAAAGFFGGFTDTFITRLTDIFLAIPYIVLAIAIASIYGRSENSVIIILGLTGWLGTVRIVRASFLSLKEQEFVEAATALGFGRARVMFRHILPNAIQPIIVYETIAIGSVILAEAALSFLGAGPTDPTPAWGLMVATAKGRLAPAPYELLFPGAAIVVTVLAFMLIGDGLRDALDPKLKDR